MQPQYLLGKDHFPEANEPTACYLSEHFLLNKRLTAELYQASIRSLNRLNKKVY